MTGAVAGPALDARVAQALGYRAWKEKRGEYTLCVVQKPGDREPWFSIQNGEALHRARYEEVPCALAETIGFYGNGFPRFSTDIAAAWRVMTAMLNQPPMVKFDFMSEVAASDFMWMNEHDAPFAICKAALAALRPTPGVED